MASHRGAGSLTEGEKALGQFNVRQPENLVWMQKHQRRLHPMRTGDGGGGLRDHHRRLRFKQVLNIRHWQSVIQHRTVNDDSLDTQGT